MNKIMKKYAYLLAAGLLSLMSVSCIKETFPSDYVLAGQVAGSESALASMMNSVYTMMVAYENNDGGVEMQSYADLRVMLEHGTSALICTGHNGYNTMGAYYEGNFTNTNRGVIPSYMYYGYIKTVNDIIKLIDPETTDATERRYLGECLAFRALFYMELTQVMEYITPSDPSKNNKPENDLTNLGVPILTEKTTNEQASNNPRVPVDENFDLVLSDLAQAEKYLADFTRTDKIDPDLSVVYGLYARAYLTLASRVSRASKYKNESELWTKAYEYADKAIAQSGCTPLTEDQWTDPVNGFNNRTSQNSWMLATTISESNTYAAGGGAWGSFSFPMIMGTETDFEWYGWVVGRALARHWYERLSDNDWRKKSWLGPEFFYESVNQKPGEKYLVERDDKGNFINNKYNLKCGAEDENNASDDIDEWSKDFTGRLSDGVKYKLTSNNPAWIRSRINKTYGYQAWPWIYVNIKFRPHNGEYLVWNTGGAVDYPCMRVEEMHFIKAEAAAHTQSVSAANALLEGIVGTRNSGYKCNASSLSEFMDELYFQKGIEFWGEGINYFDSKRLGRGVYRAYPGTSIERNRQSINCDGFWPGWTPMWSATEKNANQALYHYDTPAPIRTVYYAYPNNEDFRPFYGQELDLSTLKF